MRVFQDDFEDQALKNAILEMTNLISTILKNCTPSIYLYGSCALSDFRLGWSDIDLLVLTEKTIDETRAERLVHLRQEMLAEQPDNLYDRSFEGGMLTLRAFLSGAPDRVVYWGTSGERITEHYAFNSLSRLCLLDYGVLLSGAEIRAQITKPSFADLCGDMRLHCQTIRQVVHETRRSLYSFGWMLDIARCLYTLNTGKIIAKTAAADWALENGLCPDPDALRFAAKVRRAPLAYRTDESALDYAETLTVPIQRFADVLEKELRAHGY